MKAFEAFLEKLINTEVEPREKAYRVKISRQLVKQLAQLQYDGFITEEQFRLYLIKAIRGKLFVKKL